MKIGKKKEAIKLALVTGYKPPKGLSLYDNPVWEARKKGIANRVARTEANAKRASMLRKQKLSDSISLTKHE